MTTEHDAPSTAELYIRAQESNHLEVDPLRARAIDRIIAAGWVGDTLGALLYRVLAEYDAVKGEKALYEAEAMRLSELHRQALKRRETARKQMEEECCPSVDQYRAWAAHAEEARQLAAQVRSEITTGRAMVLMRVRSLHDAKQALGRFAVIHAHTSRRAQAPRMDLAVRYLGVEVRLPMIDEAVVLKLAGRVLDVFLDGDCPHCQGRGSNGGSHRGEKLELCRPCRGSGKRIDTIGHNHAEQHFAASLAVEMSVRLANVERSMRGFLRSEPA
jgi:hypothetical protein